MGYYNVVGQGSGGVTLVGDPDCMNWWTIDGPGSGTLISGSPGEAPGLTEFTGVSNLVGGEVGNEFTLGALGSLTGSITGQGLPLSNFLASETGIHWSITGADSGNLDRIGEGVVAGTPGFSDIATLVGLTGDNQFVLDPGGSLTGSIIGGLGDNTLMANTATESHWDISAPNTGTVDGIPRFSEIGTLVGGSGVNTFNIGLTGALSGSVDGGTGSPALDTLTVNGLSNDWKIDHANAGQVTGVALGFKDIGTLIGGDFGDTFTFDASGLLPGRLDGSLDGGGGTNTIVGPDAATTWTINGPNPDNLAAGGTDLVGTAYGFSNIQNLAGGSASDTFLLHPGVGLPATIDGGAGSDTLDWSADAIAHGVILRDTGDVDGFAGSVASIAGAFTNIDALVGSGQDALTGLNAAASWALAAENTYKSSNALGIGTNTLTFSGFKDLVGGLGEDTFTFANGAALGGSIDGGGATNTLVGPDADMAWTISGPDAGQVGFVTGGFSHIGNLTGGSGADTFSFVASGSVSGGIDGGAGTDTLEGGPITDVTLGTSTSDSYSGMVTAAAQFTFTGINVLGGAGTGTLTGENVASTWTLGATQTYDDRANNGTLAFSGFAKIVGGGTDTLMGSDADTDWTINGLDSGRVSVSNTSVVTAFSNIGTLTGGTGADTFTFVGNGSLSGSLDGGGEGRLNEIFSNSDSSNRWTVDGTDTGTVSTIKGTDTDADTVSILAGIFENIGSIDVGGGTDDVVLTPDGSLTGFAHGEGEDTLEGGHSTWTITGTNEGQQSELAGGFKGFKILKGGPNTTDVFIFMPGGSVYEVDGGGAGDNKIEGPDADATWTINAPGAGSLALTAQPDMTLVSFVNIQNLTGGKADDKFTLLAGGSLAGQIDGGLGSNTLIGPDDNTAWTISQPDAGSVAPFPNPNDQQPPAPLAMFTHIGNLTGGNLADTFTFQATAQATGRLSGSLDGGAGANSLQGPDDPTMWTITGTDAGTIATATGDALITNGFAHVADLVGGIGDDAFTVQLTSGQPFNAGSISIDGGRGTNTLQSQVVGGAPQAANNLVWGETGGQAGWVAGPNAGFLASGPFDFDSGALNGNSLYLPSNGFQTGQAVTYQVSGGGAIGGLAPDTVYYVISQGQNMIQLAASPNDAQNGIFIALTPSTSANGIDSLAPLDAGWLFQDTAVDVIAHSIALNPQPAQAPLELGQAVVYRSDGTNPIQFLDDNAIYYVIPGANNSIQLATSRDNALARMPAIPISVVPAALAASYSLTPVLSFANVANLRGDAERDNFVLDPNAVPRGPDAITFPTATRQTAVDINPNMTSGTNPKSASGGRVNHLASVAGNNQIFYAATEFGGLYKTIDQGQNWFPLENELPKVTWDVKVDPNNPNHVYATSEYDGLINSVAGIEVSNDGGQTWVSPLTARPRPILSGQVLNNTPQGRNFRGDPARMAQFSAFGIGIRPDAPNNVVIGTNSGVAISNDSGATWRFVNPNPGNAALDVWAVVYGRAVPVLFPQGIIYIYGDYGYQFSTDGGNTWSAPSAPLKANGKPDTGLASLAVSPDEPWVVFVVVSSNWTAARKNVEDLGDNLLYESDNAVTLGLGGNATWTQIGSPESKPQGRVTFVATNKLSDGPNGQKRFDLWFGDVGLWRVTCISQQNPGGTTRFPMPAKWGDNQKNNDAHSDAGDLAFDSAVTQDATPLLYANDGGVQRNTATGPQKPQWVQPAVPPHALMITGMQLVPQSTGTGNVDLYIGMQDNGLFGSTGSGASGTWQDLTGADIFDVAADANNLVFVEGYYPDSPHFRLALIKRSDLKGPGSMQPTEVQLNMPPGETTSFKLESSIAAFGTPGHFAVAMQDNATEKGGLYFTNDITATKLTLFGWKPDVKWIRLGANGAGNSPSFPDVGQMQVAMANGVPTFFVSVGSERDSGIGNGNVPEQLWKYDSIAQTWTRIDNKIPGATGVTVWSVVANNPNLIYAVARFGAGNDTLPKVFKTTDGGTNWVEDKNLDQLMTDYGAYLPYAQRGPGPYKGYEFRGYPEPSLLAIDPNNPMNVAAGATDSGVFLSTDGGASWRLVTDPSVEGLTGGDGMPIPQLSRPRFAAFQDNSDGSPKYLYIGSQGRGIWKLAVDFTLDPDVNDSNRTRNESRATATPLASATHVQVNNVSISDPTDIDYYKYTAQATGTLLVDLVFDPSRGALTYQVEDGMGNVLNGLNNNGQSAPVSQEADQLTHELLLLTVTAGQSYFIKVSGVNGQTGYYDLDLTNLAPFGGSIDGGGGADTLSGPGLINTWDISGADQGTLTVPGGAANLSFNNTANLIGGTGPDQFSFGAIGRLNGSLDGGGPAGLNRAIFSGTKALVTYRNAGEMTRVDGGFINIANLKSGTGGPDQYVLDGGILQGSGSIEGNGNDTLEVDSSGETDWLLTGADSGQVTGINEGFSGIGTVIDGEGNGVFDVSNGVAWAGSVDAAGSNNTVVLEGNASVAGTINEGGGSADTLDLSNESGPLTFTLGSTQDTGFSEIIGTGQDSTLIGPDTPNIWNITGLNQGTVDGITFVGFDHLTGGAGGDTFKFTAPDQVVDPEDTNESAGVGETDSADGGDGADAPVPGAPITGDVLARVRARHPGVTAAVTGVMGTAVVAGTPTDVGGDHGDLSINSDGTYSYVLDLGDPGVTSLAPGQTLTDTFAYTYLLGTTTVDASLVFTVVQAADGLELTDNVNSIDITGSVDGGGGADQFNFANDALITGTIAGGDGGDTFTFHDTAWASNIVDGGPNPADQPDVADFRQATGSPNITVNTEQFINIEEFLGANAVNTLVGPDTPNTWIITGPGSGTMNGVPFANVANLQGGTDTDTFLFEGGSLSGWIDGGSGVNTIDWSAVAASQDVALTGLALAGGFNGTDALIAGGFTDIESLIGDPSATNSLSAVLPAIDPLTGMVWNAGHWDLPASGPDTYTIEGLDFPRALQSATLEFGGFTKLVGADPISDAFQIAGTHQVSLSEGSADMFVSFADGASITGSIDGGAGFSVLFWSAESTAPQVALTAIAPYVGFAGTEASIGLGFTDISLLIGSTAAGGTITGLDAAATWNLPADNQGTEGLGFYSSALGLNQIAFGGFTDLVGGGISDTFLIAGTQPEESLSQSGGGTSDFVFADGATLAGTIDGSFGDSTLDWSAYTTPRNVTLTSRGFTGFGGTEPSIGGGFSNIDHVIGGSSFTDSLTGLASGGTRWALGENPDVYQNDSNILTFSSFEQLSGPGLPDGTQTALAAALDGQNQATLTATVTSMDGITPQGTVTFYQGTRLLGAVALQNGQAQFTTGILAPGTYTFTAVYLGGSHDISVGSVSLDVGAGAMPALSSNALIGGGAASGPGIASVGRGGAASASPLGANPGLARSRTVSTHNAMGSPGGAIRLVPVSTQTTLAAAAAPYVIAKAPIAAPSDDTPSTTAPVSIHVRDGNPLGLLLARRRMSGRRGGIGAGPPRGSAIGSAPTRIAGRRSTVAISEPVDRVSIRPEGQMPPVPDGLMAFDEVLGRWAESQVRGDYADLALAMLSDVDPPSVRGEKTAPDGDPDKRPHRAEPR
jgi:hypothetical protein